MSDGNRISSMMSHTPPLVTAIVMHVIISMARPGPIVTASKSEPPVPSAVAAAMEVVIAAVTRPAVHVIAVAASVAASSAGPRASDRAESVAIVAASVFTSIGPLMATAVVVIGVIHPAIMNTIIFGAAIVTTAMLMTHRPVPLSVLRLLPGASGWPFSSLTPSAWPVPRSAGSLPGVLVVKVAGGVVLFVPRFTPSTHDGGNGTSGLQDERRATAVRRTTSDDLTSRSATSLTRLVLPPCPRPASPSHDADDYASDIRVIILVITISLSSLLRNDGIIIAAQRINSFSGGRRGSSGQPRGTGRISTGSLAPPTTAGLRRAARRHGCRSAAGALAPSPVTPPRVATASLLSSSMPPQLG